MPETKTPPAPAKIPAPAPTPSTGAIQVKPGVFRSTTSTSIFVKKA